MARFFRHKLTIAVLAIVLLVLLSRFAFFAPVRDIVRLTFAVPGQFFDRAGIRLKNSFGVLFSINDLAKENSRLSQLLTEKEAELASLQQARGENELLKKDLQFQQEHTELKLLPASLINFSPSGLSQTVTLNRGQRDGIVTGQAVVSNGFLVGKIATVSDRTAEVWLINNRNLITPVMLTKSQTVGLMKGSIRGLVVENIPLDTPIEKGDVIVTSSLENLYPAGIAVGKVEEVISSKEEIFLTIRISTPINSNNLTTVFVVQS